MAEHEYLIGDFYYRQEKYEAAASRFEGLLETFPKWPDEDKTLLYLGKAYTVLNKEEKAKETLGRLIKEYPGSPSAREAKTILSKGLKVKKSSRKAMEAKKAKGKTPGPEPESLVLVKYEEEGRRAVSLKEEKISPPVSREWAKPTPSRQEEAKKVEPLPVSAPMEQERTRTVPEPFREEKAVVERQEELKEEPLPVSAPMEEKRTRAVPEALREEKAKGEPQEESKKVEPLPISAPMEEDRTKATPEAKRAEPLPPSTPMEEERVKSTPPSPSEELKIALIPGEEPRKSFKPPKTESKTEKMEKRPEGEKQKALLPGMFAPSMEKGRPKKEALPAGQENKITVDTAQPIDITSDSVETYSKENLIVFKGNVTARQKDMVIYADSIEAVIIEDGKGIEKVIAGGNVKIQQGLRVANSQKAIFYNLDKRVVLTGEPKSGKGTISFREMRSYSIWIKTGLK